MVWKLENFYGDPKRTSYFCSFKVDVTDIVIVCSIELLPKLIFMVDAVMCWPNPPWTINTLSLPSAGSASWSILVVSLLWRITGLYKNTSPRSCLIPEAFYISSDWLRLLAKNPVLSIPLGVMLKRCLSF